MRPAGDAPPDKWETGTQSFEAIAGVLGAVEYLEWVGRTFGRRRSRIVALRQPCKPAMAAIQRRRGAAEPGDAGWPRARCRG